MKSSKFSLNARVANWPLMKDPLGVIAILVSYLVLIFYVLPKHMQNRKAYNLKRIILAYNVFQIIACTYILYGIATSGWTTTYTLGCQPVDYSTRSEPMRMLTFIYYQFLLKLVDLIETGFFVLRNKRNQVSALHVYHHVITAMGLWGVTKYTGGGMASFGIMLNNIVHILMYSYYMLTALGPHYRKKYAYIKPRITQIQMIQFTAVIIHISQAVPSSCAFPSLIIYIYVPQIIIIYGCFINFYVQEYLRKRK